MCGVLQSPGSIIILSLGLDCCWGSIPVKGILPLLCDDVVLSIDGNGFSIFTCMIFSSVFRSYLYMFPISNIILVEDCWLPSPLLSPSHFDTCLTFSKINLRQAIRGWWQGSNFNKTFFKNRHTGWRKTELLFCVLIFCSIFSFIFFFREIVTSFIFVDHFHYYSLLKFVL
jgi:hypothetical protein